MIIIFEGHDESGKTNIATALARVLPQHKYLKGSKEIKIFKRSNCKELPYILHEAFISLIKQLDAKNLICDRSYPSEYVYARVFNRYRDDNLHNKAEQDMKELNAVIIYCYKTSHEDYADTLIDIKYLEEVKAEYDNFLKTTTLPYLRLNTTDKDLRKQLKTILDWLCNFNAF